MRASSLSQASSSRFLAHHRRASVGERKRVSARVVVVVNEEIDDVIEHDYIVVGSGIGGLTAAAMLSYHGNAVLVLESHYETGGAAHGFTRRVKTRRRERRRRRRRRRTTKVEFVFDTGPSFFAGLTTPNALNPLASVLNVLGEPLETVKYDPLGTFHIEKGVPGQETRGFRCVV